MFQISPKKILDHKPKCNFNTKDPLSYYIPPQLQNDNKFSSKLHQETHQSPFPEIILPGHFATKQKKKGVSNASYPVHTSLQMSPASDLQATDLCRSICTAGFRYCCRSAMLKG